MKAIGYVRVSTPGQAEKGISLAAQQSRIRAMATLQEAELVEVIVDAGKSGKNLDRPGMQRLLALHHLNRERRKTQICLDQTVSPVG